MIVKENINESPRIDPRSIVDKTEFWALYTSSFYDNLFSKIEDIGMLKFTYRQLLNSSELSRKDKKALTFFYRIRRDELSDPNFWDKVQNRSVSENVILMKAKKVSENIK